MTLAMTIRPILIIASLVALTCAAGAAAETMPQSESTATIEYLLASVAGSELQFVRNGKSHSGAEAVKHMRRKYEHFEDRIHSPEEFIELAATKSILSGKAYTVRSDDGEIPTAEWMQTLLAKYRDARDSKSPEAT
jgi:hypothetical protein